MNRLLSEAKARKRKLAPETKYEVEESKESAGDEVLLQEGNSTNINLSVTEDKSPEQLPLKKKRRNRKGDKETEEDSSRNAINITVEFEKDAKKKKKQKDKHSEILETKETADISLVSDISQLSEEIDNKPLNETIDEVDTDNELMKENTDEFMNENAQEGADKQENTLHKDGHSEIGGFTVIGSVKPAKIEKVRKLPCQLISKQIVQFIYIPANKV